MSELKTPFEVYVRIRPLSEREQVCPPASSNQFLKYNETFQSNEIWLKEAGSATHKQYSFNGVIAEDTNNSSVYQLTIKKLIPSVADGYNATCFAYGCTGAGKTHTMFGHNKSGRFEPGIVFSALQECLQLLRTKENLKLKLSYLEIYNENVIDLLSNRDSKALMIVEDPVKGVQVPGLSEFEIWNIEEAYDLVIKGNNNRVKAATTANEFSTRSHAILQITIEQSDPAFGNLSSKLNLIDLAGSERASATDNRSVRMHEGANINRSLLALGNCINILSEPKKKGQYVPYRDSKLTRLLKDSLGGNTRTIMIACVSKAYIAYEDTIHTLRYAQRASKISTKCSRSTKEPDPGDYLEIIKCLKSEIEHLKVQLKRQDSSNISIEDIQDKKKQEGTSINIEILYQQLQGNFEEHWEYKSTIKEIESLNEQNKERLRFLIDAYDQENKEDEESECLKNEILITQHDIKINEDKRNEVIQGLYANLKQKQALQKDMENIKDEKQRDLLELQIALRTLKLEKMDLFIQNIKYRQIAKDAQQEIDNKDKIISAMQDELNSMKEQLGEKTPIKIPPLHLHDIENISPISLTRASPFINESFNKLIIKDQDIVNISPIVNQKATNLNEARRLRKVSKMKNVPARKTVEFLSKYNTGLTERPSSAAPRAQKPKKVEVLKISNNKTDLDKSYGSGPKTGIFSNLHSVTSRNSSTDRRNPNSARNQGSEKVINMIQKLSKNFKPLGSNKRPGTPLLSRKINLSTENLIR